MSKNTRTFKTISNKKLNDYLKKESPSSLKAYICNSFLNERNPSERYYFLKNITKSGCLANPITSLYHIDDVRSFNLKFTDYIDSMLPEFLGNIFKDSYFDGVSWEFRIAHLVFEHSCLILLEEFNCKLY